jgi:hypothetical protein
MKSLGEQQREFFREILGDASSSDVRLALYRRNVAANLHDALAATYPVVRRLVGDAFFREAAAQFARAHPSRSGDLHRYGAELGGFLEAYPHARGLPYLPDVARLEWACAEAFHAADPRGFDFAALAAVSEGARGAVRLTLQPAARLMRSAHPIAAIWNANQPGEDGTPSRTAGEDRVLVHREGFVVRTRSLAPADWDFLAAIARGATLGEMAADGALAADLERRLVEWTAAGVIDGFSAPSAR